MNEQNGVQTLRVLIVAKTRRAVGACVGGITTEGRSVRLEAADAAANEHAGVEYNVGDVWLVDALSHPPVTPPHVENIVVYAKRRDRVGVDPLAAIERFMPPLVGGPAGLYAGLAQPAQNGALFIAARTGIPPFSTCFWRPDRPLRLAAEGRRLRYVYPGDPGAGGDRSLVFVGFQEPIDVIPAGTLLRVSLAHWWRPADHPEHELRCYVQLSGWPLPAAAAHRTLAPGVLTPPQPLATDAAPVGHRSPASGCTPVPGRTPRDVLKQVFGYDEFRPLQAEVIDTLLDGRDALAVMPTGSGKSLCYQVPALLWEGVTVVVSPLIALMQDQVDALRQAGAPAAFLNSSLTYSQQVAVMDGVREGRLKLLYTSPETLVRPELLRLLDTAHVACLAVDEAHCISQWGHEFRPEYRQLEPVRRRYPDAVCVAMTATATERVRADIVTSLGIPNAARFVAGFDRPNLFLAVQPRLDGPLQVRAFLAAHPNQSGIIYCGKKTDVNELTAWLVENRHRALPYHADLDDKTRRDNQRAFVRDEAQIIVATIAFGMGINKSNVRFVVHYHLPSCLEEYYQQIGRAGRDGLRADCLLLYGLQDVSMRRFFIRKEPPEQQRGCYDRLDAMLRFAEAPACRRPPLLAYFGDRATETTCDFCDNCAGMAATAAVIGEGGLGEGGLGAGVLGAAPLGTGYAEGQAIQATDLPPYDAGLFEHLRVLRGQLARAADVPAYVVFSDRTLAEMAAWLPNDETSLLSINGMGYAKLQAYGAAFLDAIRTYAAEHNLVRRPFPQIGAGRPRMRRRSREIGDLYAAGKSLAEVQAACGIKRSTVVDQLHTYLVAGGRLDPARLLAECTLPADMQARVLNAFAELGAERVGPVHAALEDAVNFEDLYLLRLVWLAQQTVFPY